MGERINNNFIKVAFISGPKGIRGEAKALPLSDYPERYAALQMAFLTKDGIRKKCVVESATFSGKNLTIKIKGVETREQAENLKGCYVEVAEEDAFPLPDDTWYEYQLVGLTVFDENQQMLGKVESILQTGSAAVLVIKGGNKDLLVPMLKDIIHRVDLSASRIDATIPPGLLDDK